MKAFWKLQTPSPCTLSTALTHMRGLHRTRENTRSRSAEGGCVVKLMRRGGEAGGGGGRNWIFLKGEGGRVGRAGRLGPPLFWSPCAQLLLLGSELSARSPPCYTLTAMSCRMLRCRSCVCASGYYNYAATGRISHSPLFCAVAAEKKKPRRSNTFLHSAPLSTPCCSSSACTFGERRMLGHEEPR